MGLNFHKAVLDLFESFMDGNRLLEFDKMLVACDEDSTPEDHALYYMASLCGGALAIEQEEAAQFFAGLPDDLRHWKKRASRLGSVDELNEEAVADRILKDAMQQLLIDLHTSPVLIAAAVQGLDIHPSTKGKDAWNVILDELVKLAKDRFKIKW